MNFVSYKKKRGRKRMENYYILSDGSLTRHENTIYFENKNGKNYRKKSFRYLSNA